MPKIFLYSLNINVMKNVRNCNYFPFYDTKYAYKGKKRKSDYCKQRSYNSRVHASFEVRVFVFSEYKPRSRNTGSQGSSIFIF